MRRNLPRWVETTPRPGSAPLVPSTPARRSHIDAALTIALALTTTALIVRAFL